MAKDATLLGQLASAILAAVVPYSTPLALSLLIIAFVGVGCAPSSQRCTSENLIDRDTPLAAHGVIREQRMVDGLAPLPATRLDDFVAAYFVNPSSHATYDLGSNRSLGAIQIVTNNLSDLLSVSTDGQKFTHVRLASELGRPPGKLNTRTFEGALRARYLRISMLPNQEHRAVSEVLAFCKAPAAFPVELQAPESFKELRIRLETRQVAIDNVKIGIILVLLILTILFGKRLLSRQRVLAIVLLTISFFAWFRFGDLAGDGRTVHAWDAMHYYLGAKYFDEMGYRELYRCVAKHEREGGRAMAVDRMVVRNLDDYVVHPGIWTKTPAGACRATFSAKRWREFGEDVDRLRRAFVIGHFHSSLRDHGYNATPVHTAWLNRITMLVPSTRSGLNALVALDQVAIIIAIAALWWGFGPLAAALGGLLLAFGSPWNLLWAGGSIGRFAWLALLCSGVALLRRNRCLIGASLVTLSGLLRLFPLVFVGALLLKVVVDTIRERKLPEVGRQILVGVLITFLLGLSVGALAHGTTSYGEFVENSMLHGSIAPKWNQLGLGVLASLHLETSAMGALGRGDFTIGALMGGGIWAIGILLAGLFLVTQFRRGCREPWEAISLASPLLFASIPLAAYDYAWLLVLVPLLSESRARVAILLGGLAAIHATAFLTANMGHTHAIWSALILVLLVGTLWHEQRSTRPSLEQ